MKIRKNTTWGKRIMVYLSNSGFQLLERAKKAKIIRQGSQTIFYATWPSLSDA
jgi:hypothetical protein